MIFTIAQMKLLQSLVEDNPQQKQAGEAARFLAEHYNIGIIEGRRVVYNQVHFDAAHQLLKNENLPVRRPSTALRRAESSGYAGLSEKYGTRAPHSDAIAVRVASGKCYLDDTALCTPPSSYLVLPHETALRITADRLMVVENLDTFRHLEKQKWISYGDLNVLAIFRGDTRFSPGEVSALLNSRNESVWAFYDFDPAGLALAGMTVRLERVISPPLDWLLPAARSAKRSDLYQKQLSQYEAILDATPHTEIDQLWRQMKNLRVGYPQEWMEVCTLVVKQS